MPQRSKQTPKTHLPKYCRIQILETRDNRIRSTRCKLSCWKTTPQNSTSLSHNLQEETHQTDGENHIRIQNLKITKAEKPMASHSSCFQSKDQKQWPPKPKIQSKSRKGKKKGKKESAECNWPLAVQTRLPQRCRNLIQRLEFLDVDAEICARNPKNEQTVNKRTKKAERS